MLPRSHRLPSTTRLGRATRHTTPLFLLKTAANEADTIRFAVIVGKKVDKRAVRRNRVRRLYQASFLDLLPRITKGVDILCIAYPASNELTKEEVQKELVSAFEKVGVLR